MDIRRISESCSEHDMRQVRNSSAEQLAALATKWGLVPSTDIVERHTNADDKNSVRILEHDINQLAMCPAYPEHVTDLHILGIFLPSPMPQPAQPATPLPVLSLEETLAMCRGDDAWNNIPTSDILHIKSHLEHMLAKIQRAISCSRATCKRNAMANRKRCERCLYIDRESVRRRRQEQSQITRNTR